MDGHTQAASNTIGAYAYNELTNGAFPLYGTGLTRRDFFGFPSSLFTLGRFPGHECSFSVTPCFTLTQTHVKTWVLTNRTNGLTVDH